MISSTLGKTENSSGDATYSATSSSSTPMTMLIATSVSMSSGVSVSTIVPTTMHDADHEQQVAVARAAGGVGEGVCHRAASCAAVVGGAVGVSAD